MTSAALLSLALSCTRHPSAPPGHLRAEGAPPRASPGAPVAPPDADGQAKARHLLDRFAFGPRPGDVDVVLEGGTDAWFEHQLRADELPDPRAERAVLPYRRALSPPEDLPDLFAKGGLPPEAPEADSRFRRSREVMQQTSTRQLLLELQMAEIVRHIESEYQVREVMVDFWTNHFNVYAQKSDVRLLAGDYVERVIRPAALGRFEELLIATARHPAMLRYLDNASSRAQPKHGRSELSGINENYARELLELHTVGVDGGYDQEDVIAVARILTGWTFEPGSDGRGYAFRFARSKHDREAKHVMGMEFRAGGKEDEGLRLLRWLARHPSTARHLARKLCVRLVADDPPPECVQVTAEAFLASAGDIKATLRALFQSSSFWAAENRRTKLKTPLEFLLSAVRGLDARLLGTTELARAAARLGEAPFTLTSPQGRFEDSAYWLESYTLARLAFARDVAFDRVPGVALDRRSALAGSRDPKTITSELSRTLLGGLASERTFSAIELAVREAPSAAERFSSGVALALSSPEFQWR